MPGPLLVDGHNLVHAILARTHGPASPEEFTRASRRVAHLLALWSQLRRREVVLVWDRGAHRARIEGLTQLHVDGPAEADDALVQEAARRTALGHVPAVASRDAELLGRLPASAERFPVDRLLRDLEALEADPIELTHLTGAAGTLERLPKRAGYPRRRTLFHDLDSPSDEISSSSPVANDAAVREPDPGATARPQKSALQKERRRARWQRARARTKR